MRESQDEINRWTGMRSRFKTHTITLSYYPSENVNAVREKNNSPVLIFLHYVYGKPFHFHFYFSFIFVVKLEIVD